MTDSERDRLWAIIHRLTTDRATVTLTRYEARELAEILRGKQRQIAVGDRVRRKDGTHVVASIDGGDLRLEGMEHVPMDPQSFEVADD